MYLRYLKLSAISFGVVPDDEIGPYLRHLLFLEDFLVFGSSIGCCSAYPFRFHVGDQEPIRKRATPLAKEARDWVKGYTRAQVQLGVLREVNRSVEHDPSFVVNAVFVRGGQTQ